MSTSVRFTTSSFICGARVSTDRKRGDVPPPFFFPFALAQDPAIPAEEQIFSDLPRFTSFEDHLRIHRIRMASPGGFSFTGIGEIIQQIRELIKDVWWRNKQERVGGDLDLLEKYLRMRRDHPDAELPLSAYFRKDRYLAETLDRHVHQLRELENRGKLEAVPQNIEYVPPE